nr:DMT family transporter [Thalassococcus arenae]
MVAFAANSLLNRAALASGSIDAVGFGAIRLVSGAVALVVLVLLLRGNLRLGGPGRVLAIAGLFIYIFGFSAAYMSLDAGLGALILFGTTQVTMFAGSLLGGERPPGRRWIGALIAFGGLAWLLWPGEDAQISAIHGFAMLLGGVGWGLYSLAGRASRDPLASTAANFVLTAPLALAVVPFLPAQLEPVAMTGVGITLAVVSGAVTSGLGYALWYSILPRLDGTVAAVAQLTVPVIAMAGGMILLGEVLTARFAVAAILVLGGVALSVVRWPQLQIRSRGS